MVTFIVLLTQEKLSQSLNKKREEDFKSKHNGLTSSEWYELQHQKRQEIRENLEKEIEELWEAAHPGEKYKEYIAQKNLEIYKNYQSSFSGGTGFTF